jgi:hypothetical protein
MFNLMTNNLRYQSRLFHTFLVLCPSTFSLGSHRSSRPFPFLFRVTGSLASMPLLFPSNEPPRRRRTGEELEGEHERDEG